MLGVCRVCTLRVYRQEENLLDGCPIDNGADYTSKSGSLVSSLQYVLFSVLFTIPLQLSNTALEWRSYCSSTTVI